MKINILGTTYTINKVDYGKDDDLENNGWGGYCSASERKIVVMRYATHPEWKNVPAEAIAKVEKETLRHELIHAFLNESGLRDCANYSPQAWAKNEEMVDWIAIQYPKIHAAFIKAGCE